MESWAPVQGSTATALERILATEFVDDAAVLHEIGDAEPRAERHLAVARAYTPRTDRVHEIHQGYLRGWQDLLHGYALVERGITTATASDLAEGRQAFTRWRDAMQDTARSLRRLRDDAK